MIIEIYQIDALTLVGDAVGKLENACPNIGNISLSGNSVADISGMYVLILVIIIIIIILILILIVPSFPTYVYFIFSGSGCTLPFINLTDTSSVQINDGQDITITQFTQTPGTMLAFQSTSPQRTVVTVVVDTHPSRNSQVRHHFFHLRAWARCRNSGT